MPAWGPPIETHDDCPRRPRIPWTPVATRLPASSLPVLVLLHCGRMEILSRVHTQWWPGSIEWDEALAWAHLPRPPELVVVPSRRARGRKIARSRESDGTARAKAARKEAAA